MLQDILDQYLQVYPHEKSDLQLLADQVADGEKLNDRRNFRGHIAGSGIVLSEDRSKILLIDHITFQRWQQPGGHWESDDEADPLHAAQREVEEETGVRQLTYLPIDPLHPLVPLDLDVHPIAARPQKNEPDHWHHDFRYAFVATEETLSHQEEEVNAARWFSLDAPEAGHVHKAIVKLRRFGFIN